MNQFIRVVLILISFILAVLALVILLMLLNSDVLSGMILLVTRVALHSTSRLLLLIFCLIVLGLCVLGVVYGIMSGRLRRTRIRNTDIGNIDIGVDAIESIALNAAKSAQCGIKSARARVAPFKGNKLSIQLSTVLYSDVEVPAMMAKVQERIKKDIERYTGIPVAHVQVRVSRVEAVTARVER